ncbi:MAG: CHAT domain-containing protein [Candidatus Eisenbacteria bacterium]|uniref:CHAT domain-containing protein n=1 Tax=Eiseniibacteriota bacterium TaxID=2212470 RepID=A0A933W3G1_UNCEI|nr:CHAT domain-containing protein [Candidatus Eisenbacteria bacterium]
MMFRALVRNAVVIALALPTAFAHAADSPPALEAARRLQAERRFLESDSLCRVAIGELSREPIRDSLRLSDALTLYSRARLGRGVYTDSIGQAAVDRAWEIRRRLPDPHADDGAQLQLLRMNWRLLQGKPEEAERMLTTLADARRARAARVDSLLPEALRGIGFVRRDRGDYAGAIVAFDSARASRMRWTGREDRVSAQVLGEIGRLRRLQGALDASRDTLLRALAALESSEGVGAPSSAQLLDYLASTERDAGNLLRAIDLSQEGVRRLRAANPPEEGEIARLRRNMAAWMLELDDLDGARAVLEEVLPVYRRMYGDKHWRVASVLGSLGNACSMMGDTIGMAQLREAEAIRLARPGPPDPELARIRHSQASVWFAQGRFAEAAATAERGIATGAANPAPVRIVMGQLHTLRVRARAASRDTSGLAAACAALDRFAADQGLDSSSVNDDVHLARSQAFSAQGRDAEAWNEAAIAQSLAHERARQSARTLSDQYALLRRADASEALDRLFRLATPAHPERLAVAWDRLVRGRGLVRAELTRRHPPAALRADTAVVAALARWTESQRVLARAALALGSDRGAAARNAWEAARPEAAERERLYARTLAERGGRAPVAEATLADVRAALAPGEALVSIVELHAPTDTARVIALVARDAASAPVRVDLGASAALSRELEAWKTELARWPSRAPEGPAVAERACRRAGERVRARTWDRLAPALAGVTAVWLVGDGPLAALPWQALPMRDGSWFAESGPVLRLPLAERDLLERAPEGAGAGLFAIGSPDFGAGGAASARAGTAPCADGVVPLDSLPATRLEVGDVARRWRDRGAAAVALLGDEATEARFRAEAPGAAIVHVATHGIVVGEGCGDGTSGLRGVGGVSAIAPAAKAAVKPAAAATAAKRSPAPRTSPWAVRRTWLALSGAQKPEPSTPTDDDGRLTAEEIVTLDLSGTRWVVLSACHSGSSESWPGEGALGMRRAFALAGARVVIASEWAVEDAATRRWMDALHGALARGEGTAEAMRDASVSVLRARRAARQSTHPFYWAAFTASGN